jgi:putative methyltransferase (TIGR04325 family)
MLRRLLKYLLPSDQIEGYEHPDLVNAIFSKTVAYVPEGHWPDIEGARTVLDFGGGCGLHYKQARLPNVRWAVVETPAMVACARELETDTLRFFTEINEAADWLQEIEVVHSNGALQYTSKPIKTLEQLCGLRAKRMIWDRCFLSDIDATEKQTSRLQDNGPNTVNVKRARLTVERTPIPEPVFLRAHYDYVLERRGTDWFRFVK